EKNPSWIFGCNKECHTKNHRADVFCGCGLKEVGTTTSTVANIVTHEVCDDGRVTRIVFGDVSFYLTDEVSANVSCFGVDTATELCEESYKTGTEPKADD